MILFYFQTPLSSNEDYYDDSTKQDQPEKITRSSPISRPPQLIVPVNNVMVDQIIATEVHQNEQHYESSYYSLKCLLRNYIFWTFFAYAQRSAFHLSVLLILMFSYGYDLMLNVILLQLLTNSRCRHELTDESFLRFCTHCLHLVLCCLPVLWVCQPEFCSGFSFSSFKGTDERFLIFVFTSFRIHHWDIFLLGIRKLYKLTIV